MEEKFEYESYEVSLFVLVYLCVIVFVYFCLCVFVYLCICVFVYLCEYEYVQEKCQVVLVGATLCLNPAVTQRPLQLLLIPQPTILSRPHLHFGSADLSSSSSSFTFFKLVPYFAPPPPQWAKIPFSEEIKIHLLCLCI